VEGQFEQPEPRTNYARRAIGVAACLAPVALLLASLGVGLAFPRESSFGMGWAAAGLLVAGSNLYLAAVRPALYAWRHGSTEGMRNVSGVPLLGTLLVVVGGLVGFGDWRSAPAGLVALVIDTGGLPWLLVATWSDRALWDAERNALADRPRGDGSSDFTAPLT
jgi:hypothetical protein